jgi:hypothetical protein
LRKAILAGTLNPLGWARRYPHRAKLRHRAPLSDLPCAPPPQPCHRILPCTTYRATVGQASSTPSPRLVYKGAFTCHLLVWSPILTFYYLALFGPLRQSSFNMGILSRKAPPPTTVDLGDAIHSSTQASEDPEKGDKEVQLENNTTGVHTHHIDPELERRVVRKLDWHVPPLVAFLCES